METDSNSGHILVGHMTKCMLKTSQWVFAVTSVHLKSYNELSN